MADYTDQLRRALADLPAIEPWYVVGRPWGDGDWVIAGHNDPHLGTRVCDCEDFDGEQPHSLALAAYIAAANPSTVTRLLQENAATLAELRNEQERGRTLAAEVEALRSKSVVRRVAWGIDWGHEGDQAACTIIEVKPDGSRVIVAQSLGPRRARLDGPSLGGGEGGPLFGWLGQTPEPTTTRAALGGEGQEVKASGLTAEGNEAAATTPTPRAAEADSSGLSAEGSKAAAPSTTPGEALADAEVPEPADWHFNRMLQQLGGKPA